LAASQCARCRHGDGTQNWEDIHMAKTNIIGIDLAKNVFQLHGAADDGSTVFRKKLDTSRV